MLAPRTPEATLRRSDRQCGEAKFTNLTRRLPKRRYDRLRRRVAESRLMPDAALRARTGNILGIGGWRRAPEEQIHG